MIYVAASLVLAALVAMASGYTVAQFARFGRPDPRGLSRDSLRCGISRPEFVEKLVTGGRAFLVTFVACR